MKKYELKSIGAVSVFRFCLAVGVVAGLIGCIVALATGAAPKDLGLDLGFLDQVHGFGVAAVAAIIGSALYGLLCGLAGAIGAFLYNIFAAAVGGISIRLTDKE